MPSSISVGPPVLTINQGSTFMVTALDGQMLADSEQGVFADDTRFVSYYALSANGQPWQLLTSAPLTYYAARFYLTNPEFETEDGTVAGGTLALCLARNIAGGIHEDIDVTNRLSSVRFNLEVALRSDFGDLFEVKSHRFVRRGRITTEWNESRGELETSYTNRDFTRSRTYRLLNNTSSGTHANGASTLIFRSNRAAGGTRVAITSSRGTAVSVSLCAAAPTMKRPGSTSAAPLAEAGHGIDDCERRCVSTASTRHRTIDGNPDQRSPAVSRLPPSVGRRRHSCCAHALAVFARAICAEEEPHGRDIGLDRRLRFGLFCYRRVLVDRLRDAIWSDSQLASASSTTVQGNSK